jgi:hypothetical protein
MLPLEVNLDGLVYLIIALWVLPPLIFWSIAAFFFYRKKRNTGLVLAIIGALYLLILGSICLSIK